MFRFLQLHHLKGLLAVNIWDKSGSLFKQQNKTKRLLGSAFLMFNKIPHGNLISSSPQQGTQSKQSSFFVLSI